MDAHSSIDTPAELPGTLFSASVDADMFFDAGDLVELSSAAANHESYLTLEMDARLLRICSRTTSKMGTKTVKISYINVDRWIH